MHNKPILNLIQDPWLRVRRRSGRIDSIQPWRITEDIRTDPVVACAWPRPDFNGAAVELLIGMLSTTGAATNEDEWSWGWIQPPGPEKLETTLGPMAPHFRTGRRRPRVPAGPRTSWSYWPGLTRPLRRTIADPAPTIATGGAISLIEPFIIANRTNNAPKRIREPVPTLCTGNHVALIEPFIVKFYGTTRAARLDRPLDAVTTRDRFGLVTVDGKQYQLDIRFRMLAPHELAQAQGFAREHHFCGTRTEQVRQIGIAVPVNTAQALCEAVLSHRTQLQAPNLRRNVEAPSGGVGSITFVADGNAGPAGGVWGTACRRELTGIVQLTVWAAALQGGCPADRSGGGGRRNHPWRNRTCQLATRCCEP